ncbi:MAG TPA: TolC family protein, partial [Thermoanaerobaculia bacterium]|nr:TolC family protein [Thermoanaerobaculia bacterium]
EQAVELGLQRNLGIAIQRFSRTQSRLGLLGTEGYYDLLFDASVTADKSKSPGTSRIGGTQSDSQTFGFGLSQNIPLGGNLDFSVGSSRKGSNSSDQTAPTVYGAGTTFTFTQPLLRRFGRLVTEQPILTAYNTSRIAGTEFELLVTSTVQQVTTAYWNLVGARQQLIVAEQSLALAKELHERNRIQVDVGTLAPLELVQSEAAIATREEDIIRAGSAVGDAEDVLRRLLNLPAGDLWNKTIEPTTAPETEAPAIDTEESIRTALASRAEIRSQSLSLAQAELDAKVAKALVKPGLDLKVSNTLGGGATTLRDAIDQVTGADLPGWSASLVFSVPVQNRSALAKSASAKLEVAKSEVQLDQQKLVVSTEVRQAVRAVQTAEKQIEAARKAREFQEKNLDAQKKRYENGMSTSFEITRVQDDLTQARSSEVSATIAYRTALIEYYRTIGKLLENQGVKIDDPDDTIHRFGFYRSPLLGE